MAYVSVPKDLNAVKTKVLFNLTKRQLICFGSGAAVAVPLFFLCKSVMNTSVASIVMILDADIISIENTDIIGMVREVGLTPDMLFELIKASKKNPMPVPHTAIKETEGNNREE